MFLTDCPICGLRELRGPRAIELLVNTGHGVDAVYRCTRFATSSVLGTSRPAPAAAPRVAA